MSYPIPFEAITLVEDKCRLELIARLLEQIDARSFADTTDDGYDLVRSAITCVGTMMRKCDEKLRRDYT